ncbi:family 1 glycosylhydrolase [Ramlibacter sp. MMS24-I3-19]|uniref:family 1 glycosylhydrolase n=1 Tax=Ramlibacter sp. MMS24-I3-19 TaxID=3416606 RepID=UPI003CFF6A25
MKLPHSMDEPRFMFATGIECSNPTIGPARTRVDELELCGHYRHWRTDLALLDDLGIRHLRYGPPIHRIWLGPDRYDWEFTDLVFAELLRMNVVPIVDLCHFGVPDWIGDFQNDDFPRLFAGYARAFTQRFPWVQLYTPVNEMYICAQFSALEGLWNEQLTGDRPFVTALKHIVKANVLAMHAIVGERPDAIFVQSESSEQYHPESPEAARAAGKLNAMRFLSLDLNYGRRVSSEMYTYLMDSGMAREEYDFFMENTLKQHCIMGSDYYSTNEHWVAPDGTLRPSGEIFGYAVIARDYHDRYRLPVMHAETNLREGDGGDSTVQWLHKQWANVLRVRAEGIPVLGFTWYSLTDQVDWDSRLVTMAGHVQPVGLYDLDRQIRQVGTAFRRLVSDWARVLPTQSVCLQVPVLSPRTYVALAG